MTNIGGGIAALLLRCTTSLVELRRVPILGDLLSWARRKLVPRDTLIWVQIRYGLAEGLWIRVNPLTSQNFQQGIVEPLIQQALVDYLRPGMTFYDLGANIGFHTLIAARLVGPEGRIFCFEADPEIAVRLRDNLSRNQISHAHVEQKAVWSETTTVFFARSDQNVSPDRGFGHVSADGAANGTTMVEAVSLDQYTASHPVPDLLKCDVEGAEAAVFRGALHLLSTNRPILLVEIHSTENHHTLREIFEQAGYSVRYLDENHVLALPQ